MKLLWSTQVEVDSSKNVHIDENVTKITGDDRKSDMIGYVLLFLMLIMKFT